MKTAPNIVFYDDECPLCTFQMKLLTWLDWFNEVTLLPLSDPRAGDLLPHVSREELLEAIHCVSARGRLYRGARCLRFVGFRMPLLVPLALLLSIPGVIWVAERIYIRVSRNRHLLSRLFGCKQACRILPGRARSVPAAPPLADRKSSSGPS